MNEIVLIGRLTADPTQKVTPGGTVYCDFTLAVARSYSKKDEEKKTDFIQCKAWGVTAEFICKYFTKGQMIALNGSLRTGSYQDKKYPDVTHYSASIFVNRAEFCGGKKEVSKEESKQEPSLDEYDDILAGGDTPF